MKKLLLLSLLYFLFLSECYPQAGWYPVTTQISGLLLQKIQFTSVNTGFSIGYIQLGEQSYFLKTTNSGNNWTATSLDNQLINSLFFINDYTGYIFGENIEPGIIKKTTDGGNTWVNQASGLASVFFVGYFWDANTGYVGGKYGYNYKTTDGGNSWILKLATNIIWFDDIYFTDMNTGFGIDTKIYKTTNGGDSWFVSYDSCYCLRLNFINSTTGFAAGPSGVYKTTNLGLNWYSIGDSQVNYTSAFFINSNKGYATNPSSNFPVTKTTNGGINWYGQTPAPYGFNTVFFLNENTGFIGGINGTIMKTTNGGVPIIPISTNIPDKYYLFQNYPNPFNPSTIIRYSVLRNQNVKLTVFDLLGKEIATLVNEKQMPGEYEVKFDGSNLPSGIYFYKLTSGEYKEIKRMMLIK